MKDIILTENQVVSAIRKGGKDRLAALRFLFEKTKLRKEVIHFVKTHHGNLQDGEDVFSEGLILVDSHVRSGKFKDQNSSLNGYLFSVCRFIWMNKMRKQSKIILNSEDFRQTETTKFDPEIELLLSEKIDILEKLLSDLGDKCKKILSLWKQNYSMAEIAKQTGLEKESQARKHKYNCMQALVKKVAQNITLKNYLKE